MSTQTTDVYGGYRITRYSECPAREGVAFDATITLDGQPTRASSTWWVRSRNSDWSSSWAAEDL
jgi:hypothetical protein